MKCHWKNKSMCLQILIVFSVLGNSYPSHRINFSNSIYLCGRLSTFLYFLPFQHFLIAFIQLIFRSFLIFSDIEPICIRKRPSRSCCIPNIHTNIGFVGRTFYRFFRIFFRESLVVGSYIWDLMSWNHYSLHVCRAFNFFL